MRGALSIIPDIIKEDVVFANLSSVNNLTGYDKRILCVETENDVYYLKVDVHGICRSVRLITKKRKQVRGMGKNCIYDIQE